MGQKIWLGTKVVDHKYHHSEDPKYGQMFQITAIQFESIEKGKFSDWIDGKIQFEEDNTLINFSEYFTKVRKVGENIRDWKKTKDKISENVCKDLNTIIGMSVKRITPIKDIVAYKVHYVGDPKGTCQIL